MVLVGIVGRLHTENSRLAWLPLGQQGYALAKLRKEIFLELKPDFETEENLVIYKNWLGDAEGIQHPLKPVPFTEE
jgi:hypothetical protein